MRKKKYMLIATIALSFAVATGCSGTPENTESDASTYHEASVDTHSSTDTDFSSENNALSTDDNSSVEDIPATEGTTTADLQNETATTPPGLNNSGNTGNNSSSDNSNNNGNSNNSTNSNNTNNNSNNTSSVTASNGSNVYTETNKDKIYNTVDDTVSESKKLAQAVINKIITKGMSDFEKAKAIHDYMVMNIDYDYDNYCANTIPAESYSSLGALKNKYAVCAGYALTFKLLCETAGLECDYVAGTAGGYHAWNQVKVDGKWYNVDVTWDDPVSKGKAFDDHKYNRYSYFLISDELMYKDHKAHNAKHTCSSSLNAKAYEVGAPWL